MQNEAFQKFLSTGFAEANEKNAEHIILLYKHNYLKYLPQDKQARILEVGCGMGRFLSFLGREGYENYLGVDISEEAIAYCREKGIEKVRHISELQSFLTGSNNYDLIVLNDVIEHFERDMVLPILNKLYEKLNHGGQVIIKTGNMSSIIGLHMRYVDFTHFLGFTEHSLSQALKLSKFKDIIICPFLTPKNKITRLLRGLGQKLIHGLWKLIFFLEFTYSPRVVDEIIFAVAKK